MQRPDTGELKMLSPEKYSEYLQEQEQQISQFFRERMGLPSAEVSPEEEPEKHALFCQGEELKLLGQKYYIRKITKRYLVLRMLQGERDTVMYQGQKVEVNNGKFKVAKITKKDVMLRGIPWES